MKLTNYTMRNRRREFLFPLFALFVIFSDELFFSAMSVSGISLESGMKSRLAIVIAIVSYFMTACDIVNNRFNNKNKRQFVALFFLLVLYTITGIFYSQTNTNYYSHLLAYGALCIPSAYVGMRLARGGYEETMLMLLPYFIIIVGIVVGGVIFVEFTKGRMLGIGEDRPDGLNYQNASYFMSYCCAYSMFYTFILKSEHRSWLQKLLYFVIILMMFFCAIVTIVGGGRGAFVYLVLISAYLVWHIIRQGRGKTRVRIYILLAVAIVVMVYLANLFNIFESAGATRVAESLTVDDERNKLTRAAMASFAESPIIGHGIGSIWWEVGFYSHNMFQDFMVEGGVLGTFIMLVVIIKMFLKLNRRSKYSNFDMFILLLYAGYFFQYMFSGYWFSSFCLFIVFGYVFGIPRVKIIEDHRFW